MPVVADAIPEEIRQLPRWVVWNWTWSDKKKKFDKPPRQLSGRHASSTNSATWATFAEAIGQVDCDKFDGVGFVLGEEVGYAGVDLDDCRNPDSGEIAEPAASIIRELDTYAEVSPSGTGVKLLAKATLSKGPRANHEVGVEVYQAGRYFTITGHHVPGTPTTINARQSEVERVVSTFVAKHEAPKAAGSGASPSSIGSKDSDQVAVARSALAALPASLANGYGDWIAVGMALRSVSDDLLEAWDEWSRKSDKHIEGECAAKWKSFRGSGVGLGTLLYLAKKNGWKPSGKPGRRVGSVACDGQYEVTDNGTLWHRIDDDGDDRPVLLANFSARVVADVVNDDGVEQTRAFDVEARLGDQTLTFIEPANTFEDLDWILERLGATAILEPGYGLRDRFRHAIQTLSIDVRQRTLYTHLGWRKVNDGWVYLHAAGAIGAQGLITGVEVVPPDPLANFTLPAPAAVPDLDRAIAASLRVAEVADERVTLPLLAAVWRAPIAAADFAVFVEGVTGSGKSELAALAQQHFGAAMTSRNLPASWSSTANANESLAFAAKDALLVVDDFAPSGSASDVARCHREAERLLRAQGNRSGRTRLRADTSFRPTKPPRGLILATGEDVPRGQSIRARCPIIELSEGAVKWENLSLAQNDAAGGLFATAMASYIQWLATRRDDVLARRKSRCIELRDRARESSTHRRTPDIIAELQFGWETFVQFAVECGALSVEAGDDLRTRCWNALGDLAGSQAAHQVSADPVTRFFELLTAAIASGHAHVADLDGGVPENASAWGWRELAGTSNMGGTKMAPQGDRVGWVDGRDLFINQDAAYHVVQTMVAGNGETLAIAARTLLRRFKDRRLLRSHEDGRLMSRKDLEGTRRRVVHIAADLVCPAADPPVKPSPPLRSTGTGDRASPPLMPSASSAGTPGPALPPPPPPA